MSLIHDPSAIRYASAQQAYGTTWTLDRIESDGAQVWKNSKGQTAMVQAESVANLPPSPVWVLADPSKATVPVVRHPIKDDRRAQVNDLTDPTNEQTIAEIDRLIASGLAGKYAKTLEDCKQELPSDLKPSTIFGYYSQEAALAGCAVFTYRDERNAIHQLTRYEPDRADKCHWPDCQFVGEFPIGNYVETIKQPTLAGQQVWWKNQAV
jgi:hypothetical protein